MVITFENVKFKYIEKYLLNGVSITFTDKDKVGIVGINGVGKSTLLKLICELEKPLSGKIIKSGNLIINYLEQNPVFTKGFNIIEVIMSLSTKEHIINDYEAKSILNKLKLTNHESLVDNLSGGEKKRLALAICLIKYCDILILDEPTNHLDNDMIMWLEKYLIKWNKGLIMVTHDRYFLEKVCNRIVELDQGKTYLYNANYSKFLELKETRIIAESHAKQKLKSILKIELAWMHRGVEARRTKSKSRIERFNKLNQIEFTKNESLKISTIPTRLGKKTIEIVNGSKSYGNKELFTDFNFSLLRSDCVGFIGDNGAGKTTLFRIIMGLEALDTGTLELGETLKIGYFSQELDLIDPEVKVIDYIKEEQELIETLDGTISAKQLLEIFLFDSQLQYNKVKMLSGGEKRRLQLLRVLMTNPNLLILDEPTNDLDIYTLEILENYLETFHGPILIVSHDRYFLDKVCNKFYIFNAGRIDSFMGSFSEYLEEMSYIEKKEYPKNIIIEKNKPLMTAKEKKELILIEDEIIILEQRIKELSFEEENNLMNYQKLIEIMNEKNRVNEILQQKLERYFYLQALSDSLKEKR